MNEEWHWRWRLNCHSNKRNYLIEDCWDGWVKAKAGKSFPDTEP
jgi:hypothetical protein